MCSCLSHITRDSGEGIDLVNYALSEAKKRIGEIMVIKNDSANNIRACHCSGNCCDTFYGDGLNVNCEDCGGRPTIQIIRSGSTDCESSDDEKDRGEEQNEDGEPETIDTIDVVSFCDNVDCKIVFKMAKLPGHENLQAGVLCKCFDAWFFGDNTESKSKEFKLAMPTEEIDKSAPDSLSNLRQFSCEGWGCDIAFGDGDHLHCTSCSGDVLTALRRTLQVQAAEEATDSIEDEGDEVDEKKDGEREEGETIPSVGKFEDDEENLEVLAAADSGKVEDDEDDELVE